MWNKDNLIKLVGELQELSKECWHIDKVKESETIDETVHVLLEQILMLDRCDTTN